MAPTEAWHQSIHLVAMQHQKRDPLYIESLQVRRLAEVAGHSFVTYRREDIFNIVTISE